jgi:CheY-like chemotaxis protein
VTAAPPAPNTIYLVGLAPEDVGPVRQDFDAYPFPGWQLEVLEPGAAPPLSLLAGQAILVVGCGGRPPGHTEAMWLLRLLACGCPWVAVAAGPSRPDREACEAAGAAAYLARPFTPAKLRELIWYNAVPQAGRTPVVPLTCDRLVRYFAVLGADVLLKFTAGPGRTGYLALTGGVPVHARLLDGPTGPAALRELLHWGRGRVLGQLLPAALQPNLPDRPDAWVGLLRAGRDAATRPVPGGREACDRVARDLPDVTRCVLVDLRSGRAAARPSGPPADRDGESDLLAAVLDLIRVPPGATGPAAEPADEVLVFGRDAWFAAARVGAGAFVLAVWATGPAQPGLARQVFAAAAAELEQRAGITVEAGEPVMA